ncbi:MAG: hypothetical protein VYC40_05425 [Pseudomonadota bacterium]|nr:hypothetical protein [Pseudomonadota bacterium]
MCIICLEIEKNRLTIQEARRNFGEMSVSLGEHAKEVEEILSRLEIDEMLQKYLKDIEEFDHD